MLRCRLGLLIAQKADAENRKISFRTVAKETGIPASTISRFSTNKISRFESETIEAFCKYFKCNVGDIIYYHPD